MVTGAPLRTRSAVDQIVVSVGPYTLVTSTARSARVSARVAGSASPPTRTRSPCSAWGAVSASICHSVGVACMTVGRSAAMRSASAAGSRTVSGAASTTVAPARSGRYSSNAEMSKLTVVTASQESCGPIGTRSAISVRKFARLRCDTTTPLGRPVDPDVYKMYAAPSGPSQAGAGVSGAAGAVSSRRIRPTPAGTAASSPRVVTTVTAPESVSMKARRSAGKSGSNGT